MEKTNVQIDEKESNKIVARVSAVTVAGNILLFIFKLIAGITAHSGAMISDAVHSLSDIFTTIIAFIGVRLSMRGADKGHPYGHERLECVASLMLGAVLLATGIGIGWSGISKIIEGNYAALAVPRAAALVAAVVSIAVKEAMFWYTLVYAKKISSSAFIADAWHHRSDAFSSIGALIGIAGARMGFPVMDPAASVVICLFILKVSIDILRDAVKKMTDAACDEEFEKQLREFIAEQEGVMGIDLLRTRMFGEKVYTDVEISADGTRSLNEAHAIAEKVHSGLESEFPQIKHVMVHVNPYREAADAGDEQSPVAARNNMNEL